MVIFPNPPNNTAACHTASKTPNEFVKSHPASTPIPITPPTSNLRKLVGLTENETVTNSKDNDNLKLKQSSLNHGKPAENFTKVTCVPNVSLLTSVILIVNEYDPAEIFEQSDTNASDFNTWDSET